MRASRLSFALFTMFGALLCATVTALWPTRAYADEWNNVTQHHYWCMSFTNFSSFGSSDLSISPVSSTSANLDQLLMTESAYGNPSGLTSSKTLYVVASVSSGSLTNGMKFRLSPVFGSLLGTNGTIAQGDTIPISPTQYKYYGRSSGGSWYELTPSNGLFTAPNQLTFVAVACNARGCQSGNGYAKLYGFSNSLGVLVYSQQPDVVSAIDEQTEVITSVTDNQTQELKDTTGSDTVASQQVTQGQQVFQNLSFMTGVNQALSNMQSAIVSQDVDTGVPFPGLQMAGFVIPAATIDPTSMMPEIMPYVRTVLTFVFCAAFISHIIYLVQAIFGIYEYGDMVLSDHVPDVGYTVSHSYKPDYSIDEDLGF